MNAVSLRENIENLPRMEISLKGAQPFSSSFYIVTNSHNQSEIVSELPDFFQKYLQEKMKQKMAKYHVLHFAKPREGSSIIIELKPLRYVKGWPAFWLEKRR